MEMAIHALLERDSCQLREQLLILAVLSDHSRFGAVVEEKSQESKDNS